VGGVTVIEVSGKIDGPTQRKRIKDKVTGHLESGHNLFVLSLEGLQGTGGQPAVLAVETYVAASKSGGRVVVARPSEYVRKLFAESKLHEVIYCYDTVDEAVRSFGTTA
jgi:anti-anti-sigma factor